jgi:hypothetical protein
MIIDSGIVFGVISTVISLLIAAVGYGAMKQKVESMGKDQEKFCIDHAEKHSKEEELTREKFKELYDSRNSTALTVERLGVLMEQVTKTLGDVNSKVDRLLIRDNQNAPAP